MNYKATFILISSLALLSCASNVEKRIELLENELHIALPVEYEITQDEDVTLEHIPLEYRLSLTLRFAPSGIDDVVSQVHGTPYFDQLGEYRDTGRGIMVTPEYHQIKDSLRSSNLRGIWISSDEGYEYVDFFGPETMRPIKAWINTSMRTLKFEYMKI